MLPSLADSHIHRMFVSNGLARVHAQQQLLDSVAESTCSKLPAPGSPWMLEWYDSAPDNTGIRAVPPKALHEAILKTNAHGLAPSVHVISDRAIRKISKIGRSR